MDPVLFLLIFITCAFISLLLCWIAKVLFAKFSSVLFVSMAAAFLYFLLLRAGREPYSPYSDIMGAIFKTLPFTWLIFLMLMTGLIGSVTSLSVDFSDGLDGLAGGLVFSAALAFGIIVTGFLDAK